MSVHVDLLYSLKISINEPQFIGSIHHSLVGVKVVLHFFFYYYEQHCVCQLRLVSACIWAVISLGEVLEVGALGQRMRTFYMLTQMANMPFGKVVPIYPLSMAPSC